MADFLTASDARALMAANDPDQHVAEILKAVKAAATKGEGRIKTYACDFGSGNLYGSGKPTALQQAVLDKLHALGFTTSVRSECRQFVDILLEVAWREGSAA